MTTVTPDLGNPPPLAHESAVSHMVTRVPRAAPDDSCATVVAGLPGHTYDSFDGIYIVDHDDRLMGIVEITALMAAEPRATMRELMLQEYPVASPEDDQEVVAGYATDSGLEAVPVLGSRNELLGVVPSRAVFQVLRAEHIEDIHRLAGILKQSDRARHAMEDAPLVRFRHRLPWLLIGLLGSMAATALMMGFEHTIKAHIAAAFFVPAIVYLADAIGKQTEAITIRGLSLSNMSFRELFRGELRTGVLIGLTLAAVVYPAVLLVFGDSRLALAVSLAVVAAGSVASSVGLVLPWLLSRLGGDPAFGSGPLTTILQDLLSLLTYFVSISILVR